MDLSPATGPGVAQVSRTLVPIPQLALGFSELLLPMKALEALPALWGIKSTWKGPSWLRRKCMSSLLVC